MTHYTIPQARADLDGLIDRASRGESVSIVSAEGMVATLVVQKPVSDFPQSAHDVAWLERVQVRPRHAVSGAEMIRDLRDEFRF